MSIGICRCLRAFALALMVSAAAAAQQTATFLDDWLQAETPLQVGCTILINKKTREKVELVSLNATADPAVRGYRNKKTGEIIYSALKAGSGDMMSLKGTDGRIVSVVAADYEDFPANAVADVAGKLKYVILDDYEQEPEKVDLKDAIVFIPVTGPIESRAMARHFSDGIAYLIKRKPACVVVIVDSPGGVIMLAQEMSNAIQNLHRHSIKCVSYVNGENKEAMSAATEICLSCEEIVMSPGSKMGACIPINADLTNITNKSDIHDKVVSAFAASLRAYAAGAHFPEELAEAMADKTLGAVALTVNGKTEVMSVKDAAAAKARYAASRTPVAERPLCAAGVPAVITAEEGSAIHALAGTAESPRELAALVSPQSKRFAVYAPVDRFALRAKPVMEQLHQLQANYQNVCMRARAVGATPEICLDAINALDKIIELVKRNPDFFDPDDTRMATEVKGRIIAVLKILRGGR